MINKNSSSDEVLHHLKQMELMLLSSEEEKGLRKILEIQDILKSPKVEFWKDDGIFSNSWLKETESLMDDIKKKLLKNYVILRHLEQCRGMVAYNILLSKLENSDLILMYQNGGWVFAFQNERKDREAWVNQRFNSCFLNTSYEKKILELVKVSTVLNVNKAWIFERENWFYDSRLFEDFNETLKTITFEDMENEIAQKSAPRRGDEEMPPLDEENHQDGLMPSATQETLKENVYVEPAPIEEVNVQSVQDMNKSMDVAIDDDLPPLDEDEGFGLFANIEKPQPPVEKVAEIIPQVSEEPPFEVDNVVVESLVVSKVNETNIVEKALASVEINKPVPFTPAPATSTVTTTPSDSVNSNFLKDALGAVENKVAPERVETQHPTSNKPRPVTSMVKKEDPKPASKAEEIFIPPKSVFGSRGRISAAPKPAAAPTPASVAGGANHPVKSKGGFSARVSGGSATASDGLSFGEEPKEIE